MRPERSSALSTMILRLASRVTSAAMAAARPPSARASAAVSSAAARLLSAHSTSAPSRANNSAVARPLPMPSPGLWPAPMTMAILSLRRMHLSLGRGPRDFWATAIALLDDVGTPPKRPPSSAQNLRCLARRRGRSAGRLGRQQNIAAVLGNDEAHLRGPRQPPRVVGLDRHRIERRRLATGHVVHQILWWARAGAAAAQLEAWMLERTVNHDVDVATARQGGDGASDQIEQQLDPDLGHLPGPRPPRQ